MGKTGVGARVPARAHSTAFLCGFISWKLSSTEEVDQEVCIDKSLSLCVSDIVLISYAGH